MDIRTVFRERLDRVEERIQAACARSHRNRSDVTLIGVTKSVNTDVCRAVLDEGVFHLGESRPQQLWRKARTIASPTVRWHLIGHLQRNKIEPTIQLTSLIHSIDSIRLLQALQDAQPTRSLEVLFEVNLSQEPNKHGFAVAELEALMGDLHRFPSIVPCGLMTMAAHHADDATCRATFARLKTLQQRFLPIVPSMLHLSMGMSDDFEQAIEEGATFIRLGSILFAGFPQD